MARFYNRRDTRIPSLYVPLPLDLMQKKVEQVDKDYQQTQSDLSKFAPFEIDSIARNAFGDVTADRRRQGELNQELNKRTSDIADMMVDGDNIEGSIEEISKAILGTKGWVEQMKKTDVKNITEANTQYKKFSENLAKSGFGELEQEYLKGSELEEYQDRQYYKGNGTPTDYTDFLIPAHKDVGTYAKAIGKDTRADLDNKWGTVVEGNGLLYHKTGGNKVLTHDSLVQSVGGSIMGNRDVLQSHLVSVKGNYYPEYIKNVNEGMSRKEARAIFDEQVGYDLGQLGQVSYKNLDSGTLSGQLLKATADTYSYKETQSDLTAKGDSRYGAGGIRDPKSKGVPILGEGSKSTLTGKELSKTFSGLLEKRADLSKPKEGEEKRDTEIRERQLLETDRSINRHSKALKSKFKEATGMSFNDLVVHVKGKSSMSPLEEFNLLSDEAEMDKVLIQPFKDLLRKKGKNMGREEFEKKTEEFIPFGTALREWEKFKESDNFTFNTPGERIAMKGSNSYKLIEQDKKDVLGASLTTTTGDIIDLRNAKITNINPEVNNLVLYDRVEYTDADGVKQEALTLPIGGKAVSRSQAKAIYQSQYNIGLHVDQQIEAADLGKYMDALTVLNFSSGGIPLGTLEAQSSFNIGTGSQAEKFVKITSAGNEVYELKSRSDLDEKGNKRSYPNIKQALVRYTELYNENKLK